MSLLIGYHVKEVLKSDNNLVKAIGNRNYPLVIPQGAPQYPFIVFGSEGITLEETKDGSCEDNVSVWVRVFSKDYTEAIRLAHKVRYDFEGKGAKYDEFEVNECTMIGSSQEYILDIDAIVVTLNFSMKTIDY